MSYKNRQKKTTTSSSSDSIEKNYPFANYAPSFFMSFIRGFCNVVGDGNCGLRSIAH